MISRLFPTAMKKSRHYGTLRSPTSSRRIFPKSSEIESVLNSFLLFQFLQNLGKVDRTADDIFDEHLQNFTRQQNSANRLQKEFNNYIRCVRGKSLLFFFSSLHMANLWSIQVSIGGLSENREVLNVSVFMAQQALSYRREISRRYF